MVDIKSVAELRGMNIKGLKAYKKEVNTAKLNAATPMDQEQYSNQLERVNCILNEAKDAIIFETAERGFSELQRDIDSTLSFALDNLKTISGGTA